MTSSAAKISQNPRTFITPDGLRKLIVSNELFHNLTDRQLEILVDMIAEVRWVEPGTFLLSDSGEINEFYLISDGSFEVLKRDPATQQLFPLAVLGPGRCVGEVSLLATGKRSASVRAMERSCVLVFRIKDINAKALKEERLDVRLKLNLASELGRRLRDTNETTVKHLQERLAEAEKRVQMGKFLSRVLIGLALYMFALGLIASLAHMAVNTSLVTSPILLAFAYGVLRTVKTSPYTLKDYGFTLKNWRRNAVEGVVWSLPVMAGMVITKLTLMRVMPSFHASELFDLSRSTGLSGKQVVIFALLYAVLSPVQEMIARSGIQCSLQLFLTGKYRVFESIFLSSLLFAATHLHMSLSLALLVFPCGLWWGWLFYRQGSLVGCSVSHVIAGVFGFFVVGFDFIA